MTFDCLIGQELFLSHVQQSIQGLSSLQDLESVLLTFSLNIAVLRHRGNPTWYCLLVAERFRLYRMIPTVSITHTPTSLQISQTELKVTSPDSVHHTQQGRQCTCNTVARSCNQCCRGHDLEQCFSTAGPRPGTGPWHQLYRAARDSPRSDN